MLVSMPCFLRTCAYTCLPTITWRTLCPACQRWSHLPGSLAGLYHLSGLPGSIYPYVMHVKPTVCGPLNSLGVPLVSNTSRFLWAILGRVKAKVIFFWFETRPLDEPSIYLKLNKEPRSIPQKLYPCPLDFS
jgi:hypothetical protein